MSGTAGPTKQLFEKYHGKRKSRNGLASVYRNGRSELSHRDQGGRRTAENRGQEIQPPPEAGAVFLDLDFLRSAGHLDLGAIIQIARFGTLKPDHFATFFCHGTSRTIAS